MLTVHHMPLKNQFHTGISSVYDKSPFQNEPKPITALNFSNGYSYFENQSLIKCCFYNDTPVDVFIFGN
jgi:hypothetical protein